MGRYAELQKAWDENREEFRRLKEEMEKNEDAFLKIDQEMEAMEQEPIKDSDVVVMFSSQFETDYVVCKITDQSREWVKEQMNNIAGMDEDALAIHSNPGMRPFSALMSYSTGRFSDVAVTFSNVVSWLWYASLPIA